MTISTADSGLACASSSHVEERLKELRAAALARGATFSGLQIETEKRANILDELLELAESGADTSSNGNERDYLEMNLCVPASLAQGQVSRVRRVPDLSVHGSRTGIGSRTGSPSTSSSMPTAPARRMRPLVARPPSHILPTRSARPSLRPGLAEATLSGSRFLLPGYRNSLDRLRISIAHRLL